MLDLIFKGAKVIDGLGNDPIAADVGVANERIVAIGRITEPARQVVDADGLHLMPGIVDVHTHYDAQLTWEPTAKPSTELGVSTVVMGNCGFGIAPCPPEAREPTMANLSVVEGMDLDTLRQGIDWGFESFPDYLAMLRRKGVYPNVAAFIGHTMVRTVVMGKDSSRRAANAGEIARMRRIVEEAMAAGAIGFATSTLDNHRDSTGAPMPSLLAADDEIEGLCRTVGEAGRGVILVTGGDRYTGTALEGLARIAGRPVIYTAALHSEGVPQRAIGIMDGCLAAQRNGHEVYCQTSCQPLSVNFDFAAAFPLGTNEAWQELLRTDPGEARRLMADPAWRQRFRSSINPSKMLYGQWEHFEVVETARSENAALCGRTIASIAAERSADPVDCLFDVWLGDDLGTLFVIGTKNTSEQGLIPLLRHEACLVSLSDGGAHATGMCDAGYGLYLLGHWARERGLFSLPEAVRHLTSRPADIYRIADRGRIAEGAFADILLFDPAKVGIGKLRRVHDMPAGQSRLTRDAHGVAGLWVNGRQINDGKGLLDLSDPPGHVLDRFRA